LNENSDHNIYELLIKNGINLESVSENGTTILLLATSHQDIKMVKLLIKYGANVDVKNHHGHCPLTHAIIRGNIQLVKLLVENGADINTVDNYGFTPLLKAFCVDENIVFQEKDHKDNEDDDVGILKKLELYSFLKEVPIVHDLIAIYLIKQGADVNAKNEEGETPYLYAMKSNNKKMMNILIEN
jgi:ankyrin repeat protein